MIFRHDRLPKKIRRELQLQRPHIPENHGSQISYAVVALCFPMNFKVRLTAKSRFSVDLKSK